LPYTPIDLYENRHTSDDVAGAHAASCITAPDMRHMHGRHMDIRNQSLERGFTAQLKPDK
jgi:hypothetical protein